MKQVQLSDGVSFYIKSHFYTHSNLLHLLPSLQDGGERRVPQSTWFTVDQDDECWYRVCRCCLSSFCLTIESLQVRNNHFRTSGRSES